MPNIGPSFRYKRRSIFKGQYNMQMKKLEKIHTWTKLTIY